MSHPGERLSGKSEGGANQALELKKAQGMCFFVCLFLCFSFCFLVSETPVILMEFKIIQERKSDLLLQDFSLLCSNS